MRKFLALALAFVMIFAIAIPALAANGPSATVTVNKNDVTITVTNGEEKITKVFTNGFVKNGAATFTVGKYLVKVEFNGSGPKNATVVVTPPPSPVLNGEPHPDGLPNNGGSNGQPNQFGGIILDQYNNADFHCNADGNGRVWTTLGKNVTQKLSVPLHFVANTGQPVSNQANAATAWHLVHNNTYICEECGSAEWVTFSNNSGLPDGKNIQMNHPGQYIEIVKVWLDAEGNVIKDTKGLSAKFTISWTGMDGKARTREVGPGKHFFANDLIGSIKVEEKDIKNYTLISINGEETFVQPADLDKNLSVSFTNKEDPYAVILKEWDIDGQIIEGGSIVVDDVTITAKFDIYAYDEDEDGNPVRGECLKEGLLAGEKFYTDPGTYIVAEQAKEGFVAQDDQVIKFEEGSNIASVKFVNAPEESGYDGVLNLEKTINGEVVGEWEVNGITIMDVVEDIFFTLYKAVVDDDGNPIGVGTEVVAYGEFDPLGSITFDWDSDEEVTGWYAVVETFTPDSLAEEIFEDVGPLYVYFNNGVAVGGINVDFDYSALYTIVNGYNQRADWGYPDGIGYTGLNNSGDIFYIGVTNTLTGVVYPSFCAHAGSTNFAGDAGNGCTGYLCSTSIREIEEIDFDAFLSALNYIEDLYNEPVANQRVITQVVTWALLGNIDVYSEDFDNTKLTVSEKDAIIDVIEHSKGYVGNGKIVDIVYLTCDMHGITEFGLAHCQPQLVPIYGDYTEIVFDNKTTGFDGFIDVNVDITAKYDKVTYEPEYKRLTYKKDEKTLVSLIPAEDDYADRSFNNGHTYVAINVEEAKEGVITFGIADSSPSNRDIGYTYSVTIEDDMLIVSFEDLASVGGYGAYIVNDPSQFPGNAPDHPGTGDSYAFDMPVGYGDVVYLYFHIEGGIEWYNGELEFVRWIEVGRETISPVDYEGLIEIIIEGDDDFYFTTGQITLAEYLLVEWPELAAGTYTATLSSEDFVDVVVEFDVTRNDTTVVDFGTIVVTLPDVELGKE